MSTPLHNSRTYEALKSYAIKGEVTALIDTCYRLEVELGNAYHCLRERDFRTAELHKVEKEQEIRINAQEIRIKALEDDYALLDAYCSTLEAQCTDEQLRAARAKEGQP